VNWQKFKCSDKSCELTHLRYFDEATDEIVGIVSGPTRSHGYVADYGCDTVGEYRTSTAAMGALERHHVQAISDRESKDRIKTDMASTLNRLKEMLSQLPPMLSFSQLPTAVSNGAFDGDLPEKPKQ
jgi:hypothetical protein